MDTVELRTIPNRADRTLEMTFDQGECQLSITDTTGNEQVTLTCTTEQAAAIWFLAIGGNEGTSKLIDYLYKIAGPICDELPNNLRPIP